MADDKVIIIDENAEEEMSAEELEELSRKERLGKLTHVKKKNNALPSLVLRCIALAGIFGVMLAMFLESGTVLAVALLITALSAGTSYFFF